VAIVGILLWYSSRPTPPQRWNTKALVANEPPGFNASNDGKRISFTYSVENTTDTDCSVDSIYGIKVMIRDKEGSFSQPLSEENSPLRLPIFIPANQRGGLTVSLTLSGIPVQAAALLGNGKALVAGGGNASANALASAEAHQIERFAEEVHSERPA